MQIDAHAGGVNDIAFCHPNKQLCVVSCGDDKLIKVRATRLIHVYIHFWFTDVFTFFILTFWYSRFGI